MSTKTGGIDWMKLLIVGLLAFLIFRGCETDGGDDDDPRDWSKVTTAAEKATNDYATRLADAIEEVAAKVAIGQIKTDKELEAAVRPLTEKARNAAFLPVGQMDTQYVPLLIDDTNREKTVDYLLAKARGHRSASQ